MGWEKQPPHQAVEPGGGGSSGMFVKVMTDEQLEVLRKQIVVYATICEQLVELHKSLTSQNDLAGVRLGNLYCDPLIPSGAHRITGRQRWTPTPMQLQILEHIFEQGIGTPSKQKIKEITSELSQHGQISETNVYNWFQNRRARSKRKQQAAPVNNTQSEVEKEVESPNEKETKPEEFQTQHILSSRAENLFFQNPQTSSAIHPVDPRTSKPEPMLPPEGSSKFGGSFGQMPFYGSMLSNPIPTFYQIYKKRSTEGFQSVPYIIGLFSAMLLIYYAFVKPDTPLLITISSVGCFIQSTYICFYFSFAPKNAKVQTVKLLLMLNGIVFSLNEVLTQFMAKDSSRANIVGWICVVFSLCVFVAPLCVVRQVIRTKSMEYVPFLSFFLTLSAVMWFFYGLLRKDYDIAIPNVLGFILGVLQMVLYLIYRNAKNVVQEKQLPKTQIAIEEHDIPILKEQIIDVVKLGGIAVEISPAVPVLVNDNVVGGEKACPE